MKNENIDNYLVNKFNVKVFRDFEIYEALKYYLNPKNTKILFFHEGQSQPVSGYEEDSEKTFEFILSFGESYLYFCSYIQEELNYICRDSINIMQNSMLSLYDYGYQTNKLDSKYFKLSLKDGKKDPIYGYIKNTLLKSEEFNCLTNLIKYIQSEENSNKYLSQLKNLATNLNEEFNFSMETISKILQSKDN